MLEPITPSAASASLLAVAILTLFPGIDASVVLGAFAGSTVFVLSSRELGRLSRVVSLVNAFDDLCNPLDPRQALSPHEALALMFKQQRERYDEVALKTFIRCMGIYPPGSLVQLEDERYALVLGMHPSLPLRPTLIVYEPSIPKAEALIVNLEQEPKLAIARSLRPAQLPEEALEYLNPRQQLTYYVDPRQRGK